MLAGIADQVAAEKAREEPEVASFLAETLVKLQSDFYDRALVNAIVQPWGQYSLGDVYVFAQLYGLVMTGKLLYARVQVGSEPNPDKERTANQSALNGIANVLLNGEDYGLDAWVDPDQRTADTGDGAFSWRRLRLGTKTDFGAWSATYPEGRMPLEIGATKAGTTAEHIMFRGGVARWPYGSKDLWVFKLHPEVQSHGYAIGELHELELPTQDPGVVAELTKF